MWKEAIIVPLHKKGDKLQCDNYRVILLLNSAYKIFVRILLKRLIPYWKNVCEIINVALEEESQQ